MNLRSLAALTALLLIPTLDRAEAQVSRSGLTPRMPAGPAPVLRGVGQEWGAIWATVSFQLPPDVVDPSRVRVVRQAASGSWAPIAGDLSVSALKKDKAGVYWWTDNAVPGMGTFNYAVVLIQGDGRVGTSTSLPYTPALDEPRQVTVTKPNAWTAVVTLLPHPNPARTYRMYGTGLVSYGIEATPTGEPVFGKWAFTVTNLAAGTYNWTVKAEYAPGLRSNGVPISVTLP